MASETYKLDLTTWHDGTGTYWAACWGDPDEGVKTGSGSTEAEAIADLVDMTEGDGTKGILGRVSDRYGENV